MTVKTKQRILVTSLALFNELGEPNVTTVDISNEMEISPGNLYYHYRNKDDIVEHVVALYDQDMARILQAESKLDGLIEHWLFLKLLAEKNWDYRFIFRDFENLANKYKNIDRKLGRIQNKLNRCMRDFTVALANPDLHIESFPYLEAQAENMTSIFTRALWQHPTKTPEDYQDLLTNTCFQTLLILWPWLGPQDQRILEELSLNY